MEILILIPSRYASTRFPGKPLALIKNKPMVQYVFEAASKVGSSVGYKVESSVYVATDDDRIFNAVEKFGGKAVMTSSSHPSGTDRCYEAYQKISQKVGKEFDVVVNVQGDEPFITPKQIKSLTECFDDDKVQIATLAKKIEDIETLQDINKVKVVFGRDDFALYFSRFPLPFCRGKEQSEWLKSHDYFKHVGMYAYRPKVLKEVTLLKQGELEKQESLEQLRWLENGYRIKVKITDHESIGVDTPEDLRRLNS